MSLVNDLCRQCILCAVHLMQGPVALEESGAEVQEIYCTCRQPYDGRDMVSCDNCDEWFHPECIGRDFEVRRLILS